MTAWRAPVQTSYFRPQRQICLADREKILTIGVTPHPPERGDGIATLTHYILAGDCFMKAFSLPIPMLLFATFFALASALLTLWVSLSQPWMGLDLAPDGPTNRIEVRANASFADGEIIPRGAWIVAIKGSGRETAIPLEAVDLVEEPDTIATYEALEVFRDKQQRLSELLHGDSVVLRVVEQGGYVFESRIVPEPNRPLSELPVVFWIQVVVGVCGFIGGAWVFSLRRGDLPAFWLFVAGFGLMISAHAAAIYSTRELALPRVIYQWAGPLNSGGAMLFGIGMLGLFLCYPKKLVAGQFTFLPTLVFLPWVVLHVMGLFPSQSYGAQLAIIVALASILVCVLIQYLKTENDPLSRASLRWFGLSVLIGAGAFVITVSVPTLIGVKPALQQGHAFIFFLLIYAGLGLGVARYRLFNLQSWSFRILFYMVGVCVLLLIDALFVYGLALDRAPALGLALLIVSFLYIPLRDTLGRLVLHKRRSTSQLLGRELVDVALTPTAEAQMARWQEALRAVFAPMVIEPLEDAAPAEPQLRDEGTALDIPAIAPLAALRLTWKEGGKTLFSREDEAYAADLCQMLEHTIASRNAFETGVLEERARISRDMHDNIGVRLLGALHSQDDGRKNGLIREALKDLRDIVSDRNNPDRSMGEMLADLRHEITGHFHDVGIEVAWHIEQEDLPSLAARSANELGALLREAANNILKHAKASEVSVRICGDNEFVVVTVEDNGIGIRPKQGSKGNGLRNMKERAQSCGGRFELVSPRPGTDDGTRLVFSLPRSKVAQ